MSDNDDWLLLESAMLSGQMADRDLHERMRADPEFAAWLRMRAEKRLTVPFVTAPRVQKDARPAPSPHQSAGRQGVRIARHLASSARRP